MNYEYKIIEGEPEVGKILDKKLDVFNAQALNTKGRLEFEKNYVIQDYNGNVIAGINGIFYLNEILYIGIFFVNEDHRGKGLGSSLIRHIEHVAKELNFKLIHLDTFDFQAKDFYLKFGYEIFGVLDDCPSGHKRYYMKKKL